MHLTHPPRTYVILHMVTNIPPNNVLLTFLSNYEIIIELIFYVLIKKTFLNFLNVKTVCF